LAESLAHLPVLECPDGEENIRYFPGCQLVVNGRLVAEGQPFVPVGAEGPDRLTKEFVQVTGTFAMAVQVSNAGIEHSGSDRGISVAWPQVQDLHRVDLSDVQIRSPEALEPTGYVTLRLPAIQ
jgi:hypothetical protein